MSTDSATTYDVCIVGAGMTGSAAARWTSSTSAKTDLKVCLIGPNEPKEHEWSDPSRTIFGAHYDQGRVVSEVCENNAHDYWIESTRRSIARFKDLETESGINFFTEVQNIMISNESIIKEKWRKRRDKTTAKCLHGDELSNAVPAFKSLPDNIGAIIESSATGYINPRSYIAANKVLASRNGCEIIEDVVQEVRENPEGDDDDDDDEKKLSRRHMIVKTKSGCVIRAKRVLLCPGAFVNFENLLPNGMEIDITTTTERVVLMEVNDDDMERLSSFCCCVCLKENEDPDNCYFLSAMQYPDGKYYLKVGHGSDMNLPLDTNDDVTEWYKRRGNISTKDKESLMSRFFKWVKAFEPKSIRASTCVITTTPTDRFYCDMATPSLGILVGGNGSGACVADEVGRMGAQMIVKGAWDHDFDAELFKLRFKGEGKQGKSTST